MNKIQDVEQKLLDFSNILADMDLIDLTNSDPHKTQMLLSSIKNVYQAKFDMLWVSFEELTKEFYNGSKDYKTTSQ
jgi:hypothetical protein